MPDTSPTSINRREMIVAGLLFGFTLAVFFSQFNFRPLERYPGWDLFWADTLVAGKMQGIKDSITSAELPAFNSRYSFGYNTAGEAKALTSYFTPLLPLMLLPNPATAIQCRYALYLFLGLMGTYWLLRSLGASWLLAAIGAIFYAFLPAGFSNEQYYFCQSFFLLPLTIQLQLRWLKHGHPLWLSALGVCGILIYSASDIYFLLIVLPIVFFGTVGSVANRVETIRFLTGCAMTLSCAAFYLIPLLSNLWELRSYHAELAAFGVKSPLAVANWHEFWRYFIEVGLPSFYLPQQSTALSLYLPAFLPLLAIFLLATSQTEKTASVRYLSHGLLFSGALMLLGSFVFYMLPEEILRSAKGVLRYHINLWPYAVILSVFSALAQQRSNASRVPPSVITALIAGLIIDFLLFVPNRPTPGLSSIVGDWFHIKHTITPTVDSINRLNLPFDGDLWIWLPWLNLGLALLLVVSFYCTSAKRLWQSLLALAVFLGIMFNLTYHNELRNRQQSGWQIFGRSNFHLTAFQKRRSELLSNIPAGERRQFRVLPASADVFKLGRGRNWKLLAETELLAADGLRVLYSYRELEHPFVSALYSSLYSSFAPSNFFPPVASEVAQKLPLLRPMGVGYVLIADAEISAPNLEYLANIQTAPPPFNETAAHGSLHLYRVKDALPVAWLTTNASNPTANTDALRCLIQTPQQFPLLFPATPSDLPGQADVVAETPGSVTVKTHAEKPTYLVASWVFRRHWHAYVDGKPTSIHRSRGVFMEVSVPAGTHQVQWRYRPDDAALGGVLSLMALGAPLLHWLWQRRLKATQQSAA